jgi:hypothetical protein
MKETKRCSDCQKKKPLDEFYKSSAHSFGVMCYCKSCFNKRVIQRWITRKINAIIYKGSQCQRCKLHLNNSHYSVFEFHHHNPKVKESNWTKLRLKPWTAIIKELDKCILLCANCHRIVHSEDLRLLFEGSCSIQLSYRTQLLKNWRQK